MPEKAKFNQQKSNYQIISVGQNEKEVLINLT